jgi:putative Ca2+/H+ antiporter (TMEM165/GDT1 family)
MLRPTESPAEEEREVESEIADVPAEPSTRRIILTSFLVLFVAEWGDLTQLLTASLSAKYHQPFSVFIGSSLGLITVAGLGVTGGKAMLRVVPMQWVRRIAAAAFTAVAVVTALQAGHVL